MAMRPMHANMRLLEGVRVRRLAGGDGFNTGGGQHHHDPDGGQRQGGAENQVVRGAVAGLCLCLRALAQKPCGDDRSGRSPCWAAAAVD